MPSEWGRIDADGTVWVRTPDAGERVIGSWQAGDPEAGLALYTRRFDDLATEVTLLEKGLASGTRDPGGVRGKAESLRAGLGEAAVIGDLGGLAARLDAVLASAEEKAGAAAEAKRQAKADAVAAKEALVAEAETLATSTSWKSAGDRLRTIVDDWKAIQGVDRRADEALWKRFAAARDAFGRHRAEHFSRLDAERGEARQAKERLIAKAQELASSSDWKTTSTALRDLLTEWKGLPRAGRGAEDELWTRFRAAQDGFYARRSETFAERDAEQVANQRRKEELIGQAEAIDIADPQAAQRALRDVQSRYDEVGHVPRDSMRPLDDRMRAAEQRVRSAVDAQWQRKSMESNPFLAELRARLVEAEAKLDRARRAGDETRIAKAAAEVEQRRSLLPQ